MKTLPVILLAFSLVFLTTCDSVINDPPKAENIVPLDSLIVDIPDPLSSFDGNLKVAAADEINGGEIYEALRVYIGLAEESAQLIREVVSFVHAYDISRPTEFSFNGSDGRMKILTVTGDITAAGRLWQYRLEIRNEGGNMAFQFFWDRNPFKCIAVLDLYELDNIEHPDVQGMKMEIQVDGNTGAGFKRQMLVQISDHPKEPGEDEGYVDNLKMLVRDFGDEIEIKGNSNHPELLLFDTTASPGLSYSFVARGSRSKDIGVSNLAIPGSALDNIQDIFTAYSVDSVLRTQITNLYPGIHPDTLNAWLINTQNPAYFDAGGFLKAGPNPPNPDFTPAFVDLTGLNPFVPKEVRDLTVNYY